MVHYFKFDHYNVVVKYKLKCYAVNYFMTNFVFLRVHFFYWIVSREKISLLIEKCLQVSCSHPFVEMIKSSILASFEELFFFPTDKFNRSSLFNLGKKIQNVLIRLYAEFV